MFFVSSPHSPYLSSSFYFLILILLFILFLVISSLPSSSFFSSPSSLSSPPIIILFLLLLLLLFLLPPPLLFLLLLLFPSYFSRSLLPPHTLSLLHFILTLLLYLPLGLCQIISHSYLPVYSLSSRHSRYQRCSKVFVLI